MSYLGEYIDKIKSGEIITSEKVKKLYFNIVEPILLDKDPVYYFNEKKGLKFIKFCENFCKQSKGEFSGKYLELTLFQKAKWEAVFGILRRDDNTRRFQEIFDVRGRKNGKTTEHAPLGLFLSILEPGAEVYSAATTAPQARRVWEESQSMIDQDSDLSDCFGYKVFPMPTIYTKSKVKSFYKVLSKNVRALDGLNASAAIIDEIHELPRQIYDILKQSMSSRKEPLLLMITTGGFVRGGLFDDEYEYSSQVLDGLIKDDTLFPLIYELDDEKEIDDEKYWIKANPGLDIIKNRKALRDNVKRSKTDLNFANTVKTKDFNLFGVDNLSWLSAEEINNGAYALYSKEEVDNPNFLDKFNGSYAIGGYDLSRTGDLTAWITLLFDTEKKIVIVKSMFWVTESFLDSDACKNSRVPFRAWIDRGLVKVSGKNAIDYHDVAEWLQKEFNDCGYIFQKIMFDAWSARYLVNELASLGWSEGSNGVQEAVRQGFQTLSLPMQELNTRLKDKTICYLNNPVFKWMLANVELVQDRNGNMMAKKVGDRAVNKIDGVASTLNALVEFCRNKDFYLN